MNKTYKGKTCAYCASAIAGSVDHIFAREFFLVEERGHLPKAPACTNCNNLKSRLEHYALTVLPFGARHSAAVTTMKTVVPRRLDKNRALLRRLEQGRGRVWATESPGDLVVPTTTVPVEPTRLVALFEYITRGLVWHHWRIYLDNNSDVTVRFFNELGERQFRDVFAQHRGERVLANLGNGTILYEGIQDLQYPQVTLWRFLMLGGIRMASGDPANGVASTFSAVTGPRSLEPEPTT